ncbi:UDP-N-acetylmuramate dehydrogenase [Clostridium botulinum]|uniref:UDP-N-acetylmuramate dehydrogenase n=1 Tax=Clostridium TaxID=1485 RepID=UPI0005044243|nr:MULTISPECIES: UDP-N-acetylmuramate dehydrogenase [unclassified Clostridium]AIY81582.1 UDP-N-acetylenolpyruvoylglucosamine reductase [Clostridium botulinum 202F]KAI3347414.1 UDP-N-acetylmuramate dehydrogenase [Clostridium botulinum]KFX57524.1 UDP-N-acetylenolpyruvoylglucosamine reductase [Clostridium botulinum]KFX59786.1 UDP-N-acetylenolpyruvoylglucosamine reductase [Clostridium botulinum]KON14179.1 UDP-N-acetylenolpyruvoylglucosamine reductase [Clostridium botulinum]
MNQNKNYRVLFSNLYKDTQMQENAKMSEHINFRVGGPVDILLTPNTKEQIVETINICKENKIPFYVLGNGSNVLVKDSGIRGVVIKLSEFDNIVRDGNTIKAESGALLKDVSAEALEASLTGFEFACGIPGSVGGAVFMNAGAYNGEISFVIKEAEVISEDGKIITLSKDQLELGYRTSAIMKKNYIVISATFCFESGEKDKIEGRVSELTNKREEKQPLEFPSAGSTFKRPEGHFAGKLIQDAGLKGFTLGGAAVSGKHCGFIINKGNATAKDILDLIEYVQKEVKKQFDVDLYPEVRIIGED